jgi:hypothetical protein
MQFNYSHLKIRLHPRTNSYPQMEFKPVRGVVALFYKEGLKILSGSGIESDIKQKRSKALPLGESMTSEAQPIAFGVGG